MRVIEAELEGVLILEPEIYEDQRGFFMETYQRIRYKEAGVQIEFVQDNLSSSVKGTLRGLHYQYPHSQGKLVQVLTGDVFDVAVDIRRGSGTFGAWTGLRLSDHNKRQVYIPPGFAHGFCVLSEKALLSYKCSDFYAPDCERGLFWADEEVGIDWPVEKPLVSAKDQQLPFLKELAGDELPQL